MELSGNRLAALAGRLEARAAALTHVRAAVPDRLAPQIVSAGIDRGRLTIGVTSAAWASRLRYVTEPIRARVGAATGTELVSVRIRVVPAAAGRGTC